MIFIIKKNKKLNNIIHMAKKQLVRLTESDLHRIIAESVNAILSEMEEGAGWNMTKGIYKGVKNASPEQIKQWNSEILGKDTRDFIKGQPNKATHDSLKFDRVNGMRDNEKDYDEVVSHPGVGGAMKRAAIAGAAGAMVGARRLHDKFKDMKNHKNDDVENPYPPFTMN